MNVVPLPSTRFRRAALLWGCAITTLAAALQTLLFALERFGGGRQFWGDEVLYLNAARRVLATGQSDLDPLWPPLYPHLVAALGVSREPVAIFQTVLLIASALLLADLARRAYGGPAREVAGLAAGALLLLDPQVAAFSHYLWPEIVHLFLFVAALSGLARIGSKTAGGGSPLNRPPLAEVALVSVALGLALQAKSLLLPFVPILFLPLLLRLDRRRAALTAALAAGVIGLTLTPTLVANWKQGIGFELADSSRFNLWVGLNDSSRRNLVGEVVGHKYDLYKKSAPTFSVRNAILGAKIRRLVEREGIVKLARRQLGRQPFRLFDRDSFFTDQLPGGAISAQGRGYREVPVELAAGLRTWGIAIYIVALLAGLLGIARGRAAWSPSAAGYRPVLLAFLAYNLLLFLALHTKTRYRIQMMPALDLFAAFGIAGLVEGVRLSRRRMVWATAAALLVLALVFGGRSLDARWPQTPLAPLPPEEITP